MKLYTMAKSFDASAIAPFIEIRSVKSPALSPNGEWLAYLCDSSGFNQIWIKPLAGGEARQLTDMPEPVGAFSFNPKGPEILFTIDCGGDERHQLWLLPDMASAAVALTNSPSVVHLWGAWSPDGQRLAYASNARSPHHMDIHVMAIATREISAIHLGKGMREVLAFSPDGQSLLVRESLRSGNDQDIFRLAIDSGELTPVLPHDGKARYLAARLFKDGSGGLAVCDQGSDFMAIVGFANEGSSVTPVVAVPNRNIEAFALSPDQQRIAFVVNDEGWSHIGLCNRDGSDVRMIKEQPNGVISYVAFTPDGQSLVFPLESVATPPSIWKLDLGNGFFEMLVGSDPIASEKTRFQEPVVQRFKSFDGLMVPALIYQPTSPPPSDGYPVLFIVHGGPEMQWKPDFRADVQFLLSQRVMVVAPNVRGSTGYGRTFHQLDDREKRMDSVVDLRAIRLAIGARADVDESRIGVFGRSYGGFMVLSTLTEDPDLWCLGVDFYGVGNFLTHLLATAPWGRQQRAAEYGEPSVMREMLERFSPINRIACMKAPLLIVHANRDPRVPLGQSEDVYSCLSGLGHDCEYLRIDHEGHGFARLENRLKVFSTFARFLEHHL
ncbi:peptidase S9 family protein [Agrobacterium rubi TR3 = NBRC 13261]|uniref:Peptidase S9 family protein n=1 Tax=Agrobacterium rubi TR3 = NBRC 13261 TaxID=1368415 RepID=A0A081CS58_9HYPH|nr:S9 family peptidase [Agrobacterium rubi]MBP1878983.1 dipeptidyl aminopeptidase/acylaminoacyl peptidase [Agrobacterium rubi]GAK69504.1 peptidase S9 family protein [Agrobacterium rubi TR3 = NBRC 13261]